MFTYGLVDKNLAIAHTIRRGHLRDLEIYVKGHSRSLETEPLDRSYTTYYWTTYWTLNIIVTVK